MIMIGLIVFFTIFVSKVAAFRQHTWTPPGSTISPDGRSCNTWDPRSQKLVEIDFSFCTAPAQRRSSSSSSRSDEDSRPCRNGRGCSRFNDARFWLTVILEMMKMGIKG